MRATQLSRTTRRCVTHALSAHAGGVAVFLFVVAAALRLALASSAHFLGDEVRLWHDALAIVEDGARPLLGPPITNGSARLPGPFFDYLMALPMCLSPTPEAANAWVALLGAASVLLVWDALRRPFGEVGALFAGTLLSGLPWSALYADRIWNANVDGFFVALALWSAVRLRARPSLGLVCLLSFSAAVLPQLHLSAPMIWAALIPLVVPTWRAWRPRWLLAGCALAAALYLPLGASELANHGANTRAFFSESARYHSNDFVRVPLYVARLLSLDVSYQELASDSGLHPEGELISALLHGTGDFQFGLLRRAALTLSGLLLVLTLAATLSATLSATRSRPRPFLWAALAGCSANVALLALTRKELYGHYVQPLLPFYAVGFAELGRVAFRTRFFVPVAALAVLVAFGGADAALWVSRTLSERNSVSTMRHVLQAVRLEAPTADRVALRLGFPGDLAGYNALAAREPDRAPHYVDRGFAGDPRFVLLTAGQQPPWRGVPVFRDPAVVLYRLP